MNTWQILLASPFVAAALLGPASAQKVYKSVGPDGKITFTDQPPAGAVPPPSPAAPTPTEPAAAAASDSGGPASRSPRAAKQAIRTQPDAPSPATEPARTPVDAALERSLRRIMGNEYLVAQFRDICLRTLPTSFKKYDGAAQKWTDRHTALLQRFPAVLKDVYSDSERAGVQDGIRRISQQSLDTVSAAPVAARIKWCDRTTDELNGGALDLANDPAVSGPLVSYRAKSR